VVMLVSVLSVIAASYSHWSPSLAFTFPPDAFTLNGRFFFGLGIGLVIGIYDYLGYNTVSYMGDEVRRPGRVLPLAIILSIVAIMLMYLVMNVGVLGVLPTDRITSSSFLAADVVARNWGGTAAHVVTVLILITAFASVYCGLLGGSRVPYNAARDGVFIGRFGRLHPTLRFPRFALLVMGAITAAGSFFDIGTLIACLTSTIVLVQALGQVAAVVVLRRRQPDLPRPYRMWLYPVPAVVAAVLWFCAYIVFAVPDQRLAANNPAHPSWLPVAVSLGVVAAGAVAFLVWARVERTWPFGPNEIREEYVRAAETVSGPA
jgi:amino acid transporter